MEKGIKQKLAEIEVINTNLWGVKIETEVATGKIHKEILKYAKDQRIGLTVMGTHGKPGSNAYKVINESNCPVLTIKNANMNVDFENILLPLDIKKETTQQVSFGIEWARIFRSTIHAVSVSALVDENKVDISDLELKLADIVKRAEAVNVPVKTKMVRGEEIGRAIIEYAEEIKADMTMIMTHQEKKTDKLVVGTVAGKIISDSDAPVMSLVPTHN